MKIGIISGEYPPMTGGVGAYTRILARRLAAQGHELELLCREGSRQEEAPVTCVAGWGPGCIARIRRWSAERDLDVVNLQYQTAAFDMSPLMHFLPSVLDAPFVTTFHDLRHPYLFPKAGALRDWIVMDLARGSDGVIVTNPEDEARVGGARRKALIPIGSNIPRVESKVGRDEIRRRIGMAGAGVLLGHFGFISKSKGVDTLLEAVAALREGGHDARLVFIGGRSNSVESDGDAAWLETIDARIDELGLSDVLHFTGFISDGDVAAHIASVDLMCLPYRDGASYRRGSLMAAINQGAAIVTTRPAVSYADFEHGENLWLVEADSPEAIAAAVQQLMASPGQLDRLREGARELRQRFDWDGIAQEYAAFFSRVVAEARG